MRNKKSPPNKINWTPRMISFLKRNYDSMTNHEIAASLGLKITAVRMKLYSLGMKRMEMEYWTDEQVQFLKDNYRSIGDTEMAKIMQQRWPKQKVWSKKHIEKKRKYLGIKRTVGEEFQIRTGRFNPKDYRDFNGKYFSQGKKRLWFSNGKYRWMIKVGNQFVHYHKYKWEKLRGPIPNNKKLYFLDGDTTNCRISNLVLLTRAELARRISHKNHSQMSDSYIAGMLTWRNPDMKKVIMNHPGIIEAKRKQIINNRKMGLHRCMKGSPVISQLKTKNT